MAPPASAPPRSPVVQFPSYRRFDQARAEANDAMMALLIGSRLASHLLAANTGSTATLPVIYPSVDGVSRMNRTVSDAAKLLGQAESHLTGMAIPYVQATYEAMVSSTIGLLRQSGMPGLTRSQSKRGLMGLHDYIGSVTGKSLPADDLALLNTVRLLRNAIVHDGSTTTPSLQGAWAGLPASASARWIQTAGRPLEVASPDLLLGEGELIVALAITKKLAREVAYLAAGSVSLATWATVAIDDFLSNYPRQTPRDPSRLRRTIAGWVRMYYGPAAIPASHLENDLSSRGL